MTDKRNDMGTQAATAPAKPVGTRSSLSRRALLTAAASAGSGAILNGLSTPAIAQTGKTKVVAKFGHDSGIVSGAQSYAEFLAGRVAQLTDNELEIQIYPASQLGSGSELIQAVEQGTLEFTIPTAVLASTIVAPELGVLGIPYLIRDEDQSVRIEYSQAGEALRARALQAGVRILAFAPNEGRILLYKMRDDKPVLKVEDVAGMKVRVLESPIDVAEWTACGALPTPVAFGEVYSAMQQGVVTAVDNGFNAGASIRLDEVINAVSLTNHRYEINLVLTNEHWFQSLPKRYQAALLTGSSEARIYQLASVMWDAIRLPKVWLEKHKVRTFLPDRTGFISKMTSIYPQLEGKYGKDLMQLVQKA